MSNKKNSYHKKAKKELLASILKGEADGKHSVVTSALLTVNDVVFVVLGGGVLGAVCGRASLPIGFLLTGLGHFTRIKALQLIGAGTMAANSFSKLTSSTVGDLEGLDGVKERLQAYQASMKEKFFLDKLLKKKSTSTNGIGEVQYFTYPVNGDLAALDAIEQQLADSALQFQGVGSLAELGAGEDFQTGNVPDGQTGNVPDLQTGHVPDYQTGNTPSYDFGDVSDRIY